jgi:tripartite-type tricarboxylate transporter receptor subunit TctC
MVLIVGIGAAIAASSAGHAQSTDHPGPRVSLIVGFAVGGFADTMARWIAARLGERTGQSFVVQNMEGGGGIRAARRVATAPADGTTILVTTTSLAINETLVPNRGYTAAAFDAISLPVPRPNPFRSAQDRRSKPWRTSSTRRKPEGCSWDRPASAPDRTLPANTSSRCWPKRR